MEKQTFFCNPPELNWKMQYPGAVPQMPKQSSDHPNLTYHQRIDQSTNFESALSSLVSSPPSNPPASATDNLVIRELIGRLGSICNSDEISPTPSNYQIANSSCHTSPVNSPHISLSVFGNPAVAANPSLVEKAARYSTFCGSVCRSYGGGQFMLPEACKLSMVFSSQSLKTTSGEFNNGVPVSNVGKLRNALEDFPGSGNGKKRKVVPKGKGKEAPLSSSVTVVTDPPKGAGVEGCNAKRSKLPETIGTEKNSAQQDGYAKKKQEEEKSAGPPELHKDYIHVRARRGQATDSHSLSERVRREKISERMKLLQDLVPGCNKVTGKAGMLDEIINYVQLLQRQVEFLSMKLATINPQLDINMDDFDPKNIHQTCGPMLPQQAFLLETTSSTFSLAKMPQGVPLIASGELQCEVNRLGYSSLSTNLSMQFPTLQGFGDASHQLGTFSDDDLQSVVQMGFSQQNSAFTSQNFQGSAGISGTMVEL